MHPKTTGKAASFKCIILEQLSDDREVLLSLSHARHCFMYTERPCTNANETDPCTFIECNEYHNSDLDSSSVHIWQMMQWRCSHRRWCEIYAASCVKICRMKFKRYGATEVFFNPFFTQRLARVFSVRAGTTTDWYTGSALLTSQL